MLLRHSDPNLIQVSTFTLILTTNSGYSYFYGSIRTVGIDTVTFSSRTMASSALPCNP